MLQGKKAYICSPLSAPDPEGVQHNMELAKYYLMQMKRLYHCRTFASHAHLPLMLDDRIPEERETAMQIGALMKIFYKAMVQILEYYLQQPIEIVREKLGVYIDYIQEEDLKFSEFGEKIAKRLSDEK